jgi:integrase
MADFSAAATSDKTRQIYKSALVDFLEFCHDQKREALPASIETVGLYITACAKGGLKVPTINIRLAAISKAHKLKHLTDPTQAPEIREVLMPGIRRKIKIAPVKKEPLTIEVLTAMLQHIDPGLPGIRDRALLIVDFAGAFRRSELVGLNVEDVRFKGDSVTITIRNSKTDQEGAGMVKHLPLLTNADLCPVRALRSWLDSAKLTTGPIFRPFNRWGELRSVRLSDRSVANIIKLYAARAGLPSGDYSGHSARRGWITAALGNDATLFDVMDQSGHKRVDTVREYNDQAGRGALRAGRAAFGE